MTEDRVLIVEDDVGIREALQAFLEMEYFEVDSVSNGKEALQYLENGKRPKVILLDLMMPVMNGYVFLSEFKNQIFSKVPIIILSAASDAEKIARSENYDFVGKPLDLELLVKKIRNLH